MSNRWLLPALLVALALASCAKGSASTVTEGPDVTVRMYDNRFEFTEIHIPAGGSVTFVGAGRNAHNAVAADGSWSTKDVFGSDQQYKGDEATLTFDTPGEYDFYCTFHGNAQGGGMAGKLIVDPPGQ